MWHDSDYGYAYPTIYQSTTPCPVQYSMPPPSIQPFPNLGAPPLWYMSLPPPPLVSESSSSTELLHDSAVSFPLPVYSDWITPHPMYQMSASGSDNQSPVSSLSSDSQTIALRSPVAEKLRCFVEQNPNHLYQIEFQVEQIPKFIITPIQLHVSSENQMNSLLDTSNSQNRQSAEESSLQGDYLSSDPPDTTSENEEEFQGTTSISPQTPSDSSSTPPSSADNSDLSSKNTYVSPLPKQRIDNIQYILNDFVKKKFSDMQIAGYKMELPNKTEENNLAIRFILYDKDNKVTSLKMTLEAEEEISDQFHMNIHNQSPHSLSTHADKSHRMKTKMKNDLMCNTKQKPYFLGSYASLKKCPSRRSARLWINMCKKARDMVDEKDEEENLIYQTYVRDFHNEDIQYRRLHCNTKKYKESLQTEENRYLSVTEKPPLSTNETALPADSTGTIKQNLQNRPGIFPEISINGGALNENNRNSENLQVNGDNDRESNNSSADTVILDHFKMRSNLPMCVIHMSPNEAASNQGTIQDLSTPITSPHNNQLSDAATANGFVTSTPKRSRPKPRRTLQFEDASLNQYDWARKSVTTKKMKTEANNRILNK